MGCRFAFAPEAIAWFRPRPSLAAFFRQYYRYARGDGKADLWRARHTIRYATYLTAVALTRRVFSPVLPVRAWRRQSRPLACSPHDSVRDVPHSGGPPRATESPKLATPRGCCCLLTATLSAPGPTWVIGYTDGGVSSWLCVCRHPRPPWQRLDLRGLSGTRMVCALALVPVIRCVGDVAK